MHSSLRLPRLLPRLVLAGLALMAATFASGQALVVTSTTTLPADTTLSYTSITVESGATLDIGGGSTITVTGTITVHPGGTILLRGKDTTAQVGGAWAGAGVTLNAANITVAATGRISADGQGYRNGAGPGYNRLGDGYYSMGASHGGLGIPIPGYAIPPAYGDPLAPTGLGSSGGVWIGGEQSAGGGAIRLIVSGTLTLQGEISADGTGSGTYYAGGTGGSIWVTAGTLTGAGTFSADASGRNNSNAACSGGRIAVHYANAAGYTGFAGATALATPGTSAESGTIVFVDTSVAGGGHLRVFQRADFVADSLVVFGAITVESGGLIRVGGGSTVEVAGALTIADSATLLCQGRNTSAKIGEAWAGVGVTLRAGRVSIAATGKLSADGQGYVNGAGPGYNRLGEGYYNMGASHGGLGTPQVGYAIGPTYGDQLEPTALGSSGGAWITGDQSLGGGAIRLIVDSTLALDGEITADGTGSGTYHAGGTGGSIWVTTATLTGTGRFTADASGRSGSSAACSGGRIAVHYASAAGFSGFTASSANPTPGTAAEPGTMVFLDTSVTNLHLRVFQRARFAPDATAHFGRVTLDDAALVELGGGGIMRVDDALVVQGASQLRVETKNNAAKVDGAWAGAGGFIQARTVTVSSDSSLHADGQGYRNGAGPGFSGTAYTDYQIGASHGGRGRSGTSTPVAAAYGDALQPTDPGSASGVWTGGEQTAGGGAIHLVVGDTLTVDGRIGADGVGSGTYHGGATGGSLWIETQALRGTGRFTADARVSSNSSSQCAGGRIAVYYRDATGFGGFTTSSANSGGTLAQEGSLMFIDTSMPGYGVRITQRLGIAEDQTVSFGALTLEDGALLELGGGSALDVAGALTITGNSRLLVHARDRLARVGGAWVGTGGTISAGDLTVEAGSHISADGAGYANGAGPGFLYTTNNDYHIGSSHGGYGRAGNGHSIPPPYGSALEPVALGSSGGIWTTGEWTAGGGAIRILVDGTLMLNGRISADGLGAGNYHGGASGGSLWVTTGTLSGVGSFTANAFGSQGSQGQSAGGRIAIYSDDATAFTGFASSTATKGGTAAGGAAGEDGTVLFIDTSTGGRAARVFTRLATETDRRLALDALTLEPGSSLDLRGRSTLAVTGLFEVKTGATVNLLSVDRAARTGTTMGGAWTGAGGAIDAGSMIIASGARLDGDGQGYVQGAGPGGYATWGDYRTGASHGGRGGGPGVAATYGSERAPLDLGSAGGLWTSGVTTSGGGAVLINVVDALTLDGVITVDATAVGAYHAGAAGGSVMINAGMVSGSGSITADAIKGENSAGGSGGGRIAVHTYGVNSLAPSQYSVRGSRSLGGLSGEDGTVHLGTTPAIDFIPPFDALLHGAETIRWGGLALNPRTTAYDVLVSGGGQSALLVSGISTPQAHTWDTTAFADGLYELRVIARDPSGAVVAEVARPVTVVNDAIWHSGTLSASETWAAGRVHLVEGTLTIAAPATLTIAPGAVVKFLPGASIAVSSGATLNVPSTSDARTVLTDVADDTVGGDTNRDGAGSRPIPGRWSGIVAAAGSTVTLSELAEVRYIVNTRSGTLATSQTWLGNQIHVVTGDVTIPSGVTLTIMPGAVVKLADKTGLVVNGGGTLSALGTLAQPIVFTSVKDDAVGGDTNADGNTTAPAAGNWRWLHIMGTADLRHAHLLYAGGTPSGTWETTGAIRTSGGANVTLDNSFIKDAFFDGVLPWGGTMTITNSVITRADRGIMAHPGSTVTVTNTTVDSCREGINCHGGTITIANTLVTNCLVSGIQYDFGVITAITHSNVWNTAPTAVNYRNTADRTGTAGNISRDPRYRDAIRDDFRLGHLSPAVDSADGTLAPAVDALGVARYDDPRVTNTGTGGFADMGAYEFADTAPSLLDLAPVRVDGPSEIASGSTVAVRWSVRNVGPVAITGPWRDRVSLQPAADRAAPALAAGEFAVGAALRLGPGESAEFSRDVVVPPGIEGRYRWVVDANVHSDVFEGPNTANNRRIADAATQMSVRALEVGGSVSGAFTAAGVPSLFKITPAAGTDVVLRLDRTGTGGWSRIAIAEERLPTLADHDTISTEWNAPDASATIAPASGATYYVALYPVQLPATPLAFTLGAQTAGFALTQVGLASGSNRGTVTIPITGTGLRAGSTATLTRSGAAPITAGTTYLADGTRLHATFDLSGAAPGVYALSVDQSGVVRTLADAFTVTAGAPGELRTAVHMPPVVRAGRQFTAWIEYENVGQTDLVLPIIGVTSPEGIPLTLTAGDAGRSSLSVLAVSPVGTPWILGPGQSGRVAVLYTARGGSNRIQTSVTTTASTATMNWSAVRTELRPTVNVPAGWDAAWDATVALYGTTTGDYARWVLEAFQLWHARTGAISHDPAPALRHALDDRIQGATARVEGRVYLGDTTRPLGGVIVSLLDDFGGVAAAAVSARDGFVRFPSAPAGVFVPAFEDHLPPALLEKVRVTTTGPAAAPTWVLREGGSIRGTVLLDGTLDRAAVAVAATEARGTHSAASEIDALGRYHLRGLPAGTYTLALVGDGLVPAMHGGIAVALGESVTGPTFTVAVPGRISGVVTRADTAAPLAGATVVASADGLAPATATTDSAGAFTLTGLGRGDYTVTARAGGFLPATTGVVSLAPQGHITGIALALPRASALAGTVSAGGQPVADALVVVGDQTRILGADLTAADGSYSIDGLPAGTWDTSVDHGAFAPQSLNVVLAAGATVTQNYALTPARRIEGAVRVAGTGDGVPGVMLRLVAPDGSVSHVFTDEHGGIAFGRLGDGTYTLSLEDGSQRKTFTVSGTTVTGELDFSISAGAIHGWVRAADGTTPTTAIVQLVANNEVVLAQSTTSAGEYAFAHVAPGTYTLRFASLDAFFAELTGVAVTAGTTTEVAPAMAGGATLDITVTSGGTPVAADVPVFLRGDDAALGTYAWRLAETDTSGRARFTGLAPGVYQIRAVGAEGSSAFTAVTITGGAHTGTLALAGVATLRGTVRDSAGAPVVGARVAAQRIGYPSEHYNMTTGRDGSYQLTTLPPGTYDLWFAHTPRQLPAARLTPVARPGVVLAAGATIVQDATLAISGSGISGTLAAADGSTPLSAVVELRTPAGLTVASAAVAPDGAFSLPHVPTGTYTLATRALHFSVAAENVSVTAGVPLAGITLDATWVGGFGVLFDARGSAGAGGAFTALADLPSFDGFDSAWAQRAYNALSEWIRGKLGEPPFKQPNLTRPAGLFDSDCPCPEAIAAWQRALHYQKYADLQWDQWHEYWQGRQEEIWASVGLFGTNLLKLAGSIASATATAPTALKDLQEARKAALEAMNTFPRNSAKFADASRAFLQAGEGIRSLEKLMANIGTPANVLSSGIADADGNFSGTLGNFQSLKNFLSDPVATFSTDQGLVAFVENVNGLLNNISGAMGAITVLADLANRDAFGSIGGLADKLGPITEGLQTVIEAGRTINALLGASKALADYEATYKHRIVMRDRWYQECLDLLAACRARSDCEDDDEDDKPKPPAPDGGKPGGEGGSGGVGSYDPNDKASTGVGENGYITPGSPIYYHIRFENVSTATAAAQLVTIADQLSPSLDWSTFELVSIGFNGTTLTPPPGLQSYRARTSVASDPNPVDVTFSLNPDTGLAFWSMRSVDAVSGDWPEDPFAGFLPPNDATGRGEGHVGFLIRPRADLADGASFTNQARIIFDDNAPIDTNVVTNTIDSTAATASIVPLASQVGANFLVSWNGNDAGSGVARYELWVSTDGGAFTLWSDALTGSSALFNGQVGRTYAFYVRAFDALGQAVALSPVAQTTTTTVENARVSRLVNLSTRGVNGTGSDAMIVGFYVQAGAGGAPTKRLLLRGVGPGLGRFNVPGTLADPRLDLYDRHGVVFGANDDWGQGAGASQLPSEFARLSAFGLTAGSADAAMLVDLAPTGYTARVTGAADSTGVTLVEAYDADTSVDAASPRLINLSTRGRVGTGGEVLIAGFVISGDTPKSLLIRAVGPTLGGAPFNVPGVLADPRIRLVDGTETTVLENDDWANSPDPLLISSISRRVGAFGLPSGSKDAVMVVVLPPGSYTAIVSGADGGTGIAIVELYDADL